jgi:hypothetical protein
LTPRDGVCIVAVRDASEDRPLGSKKDAAQPGAAECAVGNDPGGDGGSAK